MKKRLELEEIRKIGAQKIYTACNEAFSGRPQKLNAMGCEPASLGDVYSMHSTAYALLTPSQKATDYSQAASLLGKLGGSKTSQKKKKTSAENGKLGGLRHFHFNDGKFHAECKKCQADLENKKVTK